MLPLSFVVTCLWFSADIHVPLDHTDAGSLAKTTNAFLGTVFHNEVNLTTVDTPHVTLYLTDWDCSGMTQPLNDSACLSAVEDAIFDVSYDLHRHEPCVTVTSQIFGTGNYAMLGMQKPACLQFLSDRIVNVTSRFARPNQPVPAWVLQLPEPQRSEKIRLVKLYGSPNVFSGFSPHITVGWGENETRVADGVRRAPASKAPLKADMVNIGQVGLYGTVLRGKDFAAYNLSMAGDACNAQHAKNRTSCLGDRVTDGGCAWCDIVDHGAACYASTEARRFEPPPRGPPFMCQSSRTVS